MNCPACKQPLEVVPRVVKGSPFIRVQCVNRKCGMAVMGLGDDQADAEKDFTEQFEKENKS